MVVCPNCKKLLNEVGDYCYDFYTKMITCGKCSHSDIKYRFMNKIEIDEELQGE